MNSSLNKSNHLGDVEVAKVKTRSGRVASKIIIGNTKVNITRRPPNRKVISPKDLKCMSTCVVNLVNLKSRRLECLKKNFDSTLSKVNFAKRKKSTRNINNNDVAVEGNLNNNNTNKFGRSAVTKENAVVKSLIYNVRSPEELNYMSKCVVNVVRLKSNVFRCLQHTKKRYGDPTLNKENRTNNRNKSTHNNNVGVKGNSNNNKITNKFDDENVNVEKALINGKKGVAGKVTFRKKDMKTIDEAKGLRRRKTWNYAELSQAQSPKQNDDHEPVYKNCSPINDHKRGPDVYDFKTEPKRNNQTESDDEFEKGMMSLIRDLEKKPKRVRAPKKTKPAPNVAELRTISKVQDNLRTVPSTTNVVGPIEVSTPRYNPLISAASQTSDCEPYDDCDDDLGSVREGFFTASSVITEQSNARRKKSSLNGNSILEISFRHPEANSTFAGKPSPWRVPVKVNSVHVLEMKTTHMPTYDQDMVISSGFLQKIGNSTLESDKSTNDEVSILQVPAQPTVANTTLETETSPDEVSNLQVPAQPTVGNSVPEGYKTPNRLLVTETKSSTKKRTKQTSILRFLNTGDIEDNTYADENQFNSTLFDAHELSPMKTPRGILTERNSQKSLVKPLDLTFGWSDDSFLGHQTDEVASKKPTRISLGEIKRLKLAEERKMANTGDELVNNDTEAEAPEADEDVQDIIVELPEAVEDDQMASLGLFEDYPDAVVPPRTTYQRKPRSKRVRCQSATVDPEEPDEQIEHDTKRRKNVHTKEEELEFKQWVTNFNKMYTEVEGHSLEID